MQATILKQMPVIEEAVEQNQPIIEETEKSSIEQNSQDLTKEENTSVVNIGNEIELSSENEVSKIESSNEVKYDLFYDIPTSKAFPSVRELILKNFNIEEDYIIREGNREVIYSPYGYEKITIRYVSNNSCLINLQVFDEKNNSIIAGNQMHLIRNIKIFTNDIIKTVNSIIQENKNWKLSPK
ncbi:MAG: hypothetical protein ACRC4L_01090 [Mycoplasma sp.]